MLTPGTLKILISGANDLDKLVTVGEQRPYYVLECGQQRSRSRACAENGCNPVWNTAHKFNLNQEAGVVAIIKDEITKGIIGQGVIELTRARQYGKDEGAAVLMNMGGTPAGSLRYKLKFQSSPASAPVPYRSSETGSHASQDARSPAGPAAPPGIEEDDAMLAAVTNKVSLAKAAMQQLTAELAELTGADTAAEQHSAGHQYQQQQHQQQQRQPAMQPRSMQERPRDAHGATFVHQQRSLQPISTATSPSPLAVSPSLSPRVSATGARGGDIAGWMSSWPGQSSGGIPDGEPRQLSVEDLLATYGARGAPNGQQDFAAGVIGNRQLIQQLQEALAAAHAEKVAAEDELSSVKQAMAIMSKQHYLDMKRMRDTAASGSMGAGHGETGHGIVAMVDYQGSPQQRGLASPQQLQRRSLEPVVSRAADIAADKDADSPVPAYKLQIQIHQLERQLAEQAAAKQEEVATREAQTVKLAELQRQLDVQADAIKQAEANTRAAEQKAAEQATQAAAARSQLTAALAASDPNSGKEAALAAELAGVKAELAAASTEKSELEEALGLMEKNNLAQVAALQGELTKLQEQNDTLRQVSNSEEVEYLQSQLRRTLRQVVELQHQVQVLQQNARQAAVAENGGEDDAEEHAVIKSEHELLMQELVSTKLELAQLKEKQLVTQRQLFKAQEVLRRDGNQYVFSGREV